jgi:ribosomal protein S18 acetylase RimI-like enzyme
VLPLRYSKRFYHDLLQNPQLAKLCRVATTTTNDDGQQKVVGALCVAWNDANSTEKSKIKRNPSKENTNGNGDGETIVVDKVANDDDDANATAGAELWIMTLAVLAPYRSQGIGGRLLQSLLQQTAQQPNGGGSGSACNCGSRRREIVQIRLHVQTSNEDAIRFYTNRFGFVHDGTILKNYYPRLEPPDCYVLSKPVQLRQRPRDDDDGNYPNDNREVHNDDSNPVDTTVPFLPTAAKQVVTLLDPDPNNKKRKLLLSRDDDEASSSLSITPSSLSSSHVAVGEDVMPIIPDDVSSIVIPSS